MKKVVFSIVAVMIGMTFYSCKKDPKPGYCVCSYVLDGDYHVNDTQTVYKNQSKTVYKDECAGLSVGLGTSGAKDVSCTLR